MAIDIENPGAASEQLKDAIRNLSRGFIPLSSGNVESVVPAIDIELPAGYVGFHLSIYNLSCTNDDDLISVAFSADGGDTFPQDLSNFDSYIMGQLKTLHSNIVNDNSVTAYGNIDSLGIFHWPTAITASYFVNMHIFPGSDDKPAIVDANTALFTSGEGFPGRTTSMIRYREALGRQNMIRLLMYGDGTANPPSAFTNFSGGSWFLQGFLEP